MSRRKLIVHAFLALCFVSLVSFTSAACYKPNGDLAGSDIQPCTLPGLETICCATNRTNPPGGDKRNGPPADTCLPNGLCQAWFVEDGIEKRTFWRDMCTEKDWNSPKCPNFCTDGPAVEKYGNRIMTPCNGKNTSATWCCGNTPDCCDDPSMVVSLPPVFGESMPSSAATSAEFTSRSVLSPTSSLPTSEFSAASGFSATSSPTPSAASQPSNSGLSTGAKAGISVGATIGALALICFGFFVAKSMHWKKKSRAAEMGDNVTYYEAGDGYRKNVPEYGSYPYSREPMIPQELPANRKPAQLP